MRLLIEQYKYPPSVFEALGIPTDWRLETKEGQSILKVGYFRASTKHQPVFILPKIFDEQGRLISQQKIVDKLTTIALNELGNSLYFVKVYKSIFLMKAFKIIKNN